MPRWGRMRTAIVTLVITSALCGCARDRPPGLAGLDATVAPVDGGSTAATDAGYRRPDGGPRLPPADLEVILPYGGPEQALMLSTAATLGALDVFFSIDTTGSFGGEIDTLQRDLDTRIVPGLAARVPDVAMGVGRFEDFPVAPFGGRGDRPFAVVTPITTDLGRLGAAFASLDAPLGDGGDLPEAGAEALFQIAAGVGYSLDGETYVAPYDGRAAHGGGTLGGVGFRDGALHVVVHVTDAISHAPSDYESVFPGTRSLAQAASALGALEIRVIGIASSGEPRAELDELAARTGAITAPSAAGCATGIGGAIRPPRAGVCPLVFDVAPDGSGLSTAVVDAIGDLVAGVVWEAVWAEHDDPLGFVRAIRALDPIVPPGIPPPALADRRPAGDGIDDTLLAVGPGTTARFEVLLRNETIPPADYDQVFRIAIRIVGDDLTLVSTMVRVIVPRGRADGGESARDAGQGARDGEPSASDAAPSDDGGSTLDAR
jgi:hypothetical protein